MATPIGLRGDSGGGLSAGDSNRSKGGPQSRRLLTLVAITAVVAGRQRPGLKTENAGQTAPRTRRHLVSKLAGTPASVAVNFLFSGSEEFKEVYSSVNARLVNAKQC